MNLPTAPQQYDAGDQQKTRSIINQADAQSLKRGQDIELSTERLILSSPDGSRFALAVDNAGVLSATAL